MTKEEQLKIYAAYLPYGLEGQLIIDRQSDFEMQDWADLSKFKKGTIWNLCGYADDDLQIPMGEDEFRGWLWRNGQTYVNFHHSVKPVLYPLEFLTKEIEHEGKTITPIEEIAKDLEMNAAEYMFLTANVGSQEFDWLRTATYPVIQKML
jgi:hypothetical protein